MAAKYPKDEFGKRMEGSQIHEEADISLGSWWKNEIL